MRTRTKDNNKNVAGMVKYAAGPLAFFHSVFLFCGVLRERFDYRTHSLSSVGFCFPSLSLCITP